MRVIGLISLNRFLFIDNLITPFKDFKIVINYINKFITDKQSF